MSKMQAKIDEAGSRADAMPGFVKEMLLHLEERIAALEPKEEKAHNADGDKSPYKQSQEHDPA